MTDLATDVMVLEHVSECPHSGASQLEWELGCGQDDSASASHGVDSGPEQTVASGHAEPDATIDQCLSGPDI